jgi:hypothetical protein
MPRFSSRIVILGLVGALGATLANAAPIAEEARAEIGGAALLTAEHQARMIAAARAAGIDRATPDERFDAGELLDDEARERQREPPRGSEKPELTEAQARFRAGENLALMKVLQTPAPLSTFTANRSDGSLAADTSIAVSYTHVVVTNRNQIGYYSKAGRQLALLPVETFFAGLKLAGLFGTAPQYHDTHALYDAYRNRFWVGAIAFKDVGPVRKLSKFVVAVSRTTNPLDGWFLYWWDAIPGDGHPGLHGNVDGDASDYPSWGVDSFGVYQSNPFCRPGTPRDCAHQQVSFFPAGPLAAGVASLPLGWQFWDLKNPDGSLAAPIIQPALHHGSSGGATFFVSVANPNVVVWRLRNHLTPTQVLENTAVPVSRFDVATFDRASQKGSSDTIWLTNVVGDPLKAVYRNGNVYATFNDASRWFLGYGDPSYHASVRLVRLNVTQFPAVTATIDRWFGGNSPLYDKPSDRIAYVFPAVEVNKNGDMVVVYGRAGATIYPEVSYSVYPATGSDFQPERRLRQGEAPVERPGNGTLVQLHDFDGISVDPFDDTSVWMAAPYGDSFIYRGSENWAIAVGKVFGSLVADLIVDSVSWQGKPGGISVSAKIVNQGDRAAQASTVAFYLRPLQGGTATKLGTASCKSLIRNAEAIVTGAFARPAGLPNGSYVLIATADSTNKVLEYSGANNSTNAAAVVVLQ